MAKFFNRADEDSFSKEQTMILDQIESCKQYIDLTKPVKDVTKADIKKLRVQKRKLENAIS